MNLLNQIKQSISITSLKNLSGQLQESEMGIQQGLGLGINVFLAGIITFVVKNDKVKGLLEVLNDGGHSGDILTNFESFTSNEEKSNLLDTIGGNIVNHFLPSKKDNAVGHISEISGITKKTAGYLLNLASPLVLGFLGKEVRENDWSAEDLKNFLHQEADSTFTALPEVMASSLGFFRASKFKVSEKKHKTAIKELNKDKRQKREALGLILPWILLVALGVLIFYFTRKKEIPETNIVATVEEEPGEYMPITELEADSIHRIKAEKIPNKEIKAVETSVKELSVPSKSNPVKVVTAPEPITKAKVRENRASNNEIKPEVTNIPTGFADISVTSFGSESAEIVNTGNVRTLVNSLRNTNKQIAINHFRAKGRLAEDRAYALRDYLIENGINEDQITINSLSSGKNTSGIVYRVVN